MKASMKIGPKGQVVIPKSFRDYLGVYSGSEIIFELVDKGVLIEKQKTDVVSIFEKIAKSGKSVKVDPHAYEEEIEERWKKVRDRKWSI